MTAYSLFNNCRMDIRYRFPLKRTFILEDAWPLEGHGAVVELEREGQEVTHIVVTFHDRPVSLAPELTTSNLASVTTSIEMRDGLQIIASQIVSRFQHFLNIHHTLEIDLNDVEVEFVPTDDEEKSKINIFGIKTTNASPKSRISFSMVSQAFFATESNDDPSFTVSFLQLARQASLERRYIDAFRYCFLLFEALYGEGKFKTPQLVEAMMSHSDFVALVAQTIADFRTDPLHRRSKAKKLAQDNPEPRAMIEYLVARRGFYFHGNVKRRDTWRPDQQQTAEALSDFTMFLALAVADSMAGAMFSPEMGKRYFENAKQFGAIMPILIRYKLRDEHDFVRDQSLRMNTPATVATNDLAMRVHLQFLQWAQTELHGTSLVSLIAIDEATGDELFRSHYLSPAPAKA